MGKLRTAIYHSILEQPRDIIDLMRAMALFIPDEHPLAKEAAGCLEVLNRSGIELHPMLFGFFLEAVEAEFPKDEPLNGPWWIKAVCVLITGGNYATEELIESLDRHCINIKALEPSQN